MMTMSTIKTNIYVVLLLLVAVLLLSSTAVASSTITRHNKTKHDNTHTTEAQNNNCNCRAGYCDQTGCFDSLAVSCRGGYCNQQGTTHPSCRAGYCNQQGTANPSCRAGNCCWDATTRGGSCRAGGCHAQAAACDPAYMEDEGGPNHSEDESAEGGIWGWLLLAVVLWYCCCRRRKTNRNNHRQQYMDENGTVQTEVGRGSWKTYPICYSPVYYYFKGVFGLYGLVSPIVGWMQYTEQCSEWSTALLPQVWFVTVIVLWGMQGLVHVYFILARFVAKHPPSDHLYDGGIEATLKLPLMIGLAMLLVVSILGLNFIHAPASESPACSEVLDDIVKSRAIRYIVLCVLMLLKVNGSNTNRNTHQQEQSVQPATVHYHPSNTNTNTNPPAYNPNAFPVNSTAPVMLPLPDAPYQNQNDYGSTKTPASSTVMYSDTTL